jgi:hypothetical protein
LDAQMRMDVAKSTHRVMRQTVGNATGSLGASHDV